MKTEDGATREEGRTSFDLLSAVGTLRFFRVRFVRVGAGGVFFRRSTHGGTAEHGPVEVDGVGTAEEDDDS